MAADRYRELTGAGVHDPKDPALLSWIHLPASFDHTQRSYTVELSGP